MTEPIRRHLAWVAGRQVHYRRAGTGPAVLLLHQSPASSVEMISLMRQLTGSWTVFAPDTPGNGLSDPLPRTQPTMAEYAQALIGFMDSLGIERAAVYGFHSGAACALAVAHAFPQRVSAVIANGYTRMSSQELADILAQYLVPLPRDWSGAHLAWIWARVREQFLFFPWYRGDAAHRLESGVPRTEVLHAAVMDLLRAGDNYANPYRAAFTYDRDAALCELSVPALVMTARNDALHRYLQQMPVPAPAVRVEEPRNYAESCQLLIGMLREHADTGSRLASVPAAPDRPGRLHRDALQLAGGSALVWRAAAAHVHPGMRPVLFCHDSAGSADSMRAYMQPLVGRRELLACDLPGSGETELSAGSGTALRDQADWLAAAIRAAGLTEVDVVAEGDAAALAVELASLHPALIHAIALADISSFRTMQSYREFDAALSALPLQSHGEHLLTAWHRARDERLFQHWHYTGAGQRRLPEPGELDPALIHQRAQDLLKCRATLPQVLAERLAYPIDDRLAALRQPVFSGVTSRWPVGAARFMADALVFLDDA